MPQSNTTKTEITSEILSKIINIVKKKCKLTNKAFLTSITETDVLVKNVKKDKNGILISCICLLKNVYECVVCLVKDHETIDFKN